MDRKPKYRGIYASQKCHYVSAIAQQLNIWIESLCMEAYSQFSNGMMFRWFGDCAMALEQHGVGCNDKREVGLNKCNLSLSQQKDQIKTIAHPASRQANIFKQLRPS
jgi:hypothetical protein